MRKGMLWSGVESKDGLPTLPLLPSTQASCHACALGDGWLRR